MVVLKDRKAATALSQAELLEESQKLLDGACRHLLLMLPIWS